jgi:hypothetical protein
VMVMSRDVIQVMLVLWCCCSLKGRSVASGLGMGIACQVRQRHEIFGELSPALFNIGEPRIREPRCGEESKTSLTRVGDGEILSWVGTRASRRELSRR